MAVDRPPKEHIACSVWSTSATCTALWYGTAFIPASILRRKRASRGRLILKVDVRPDLFSKKKPRTDSAWPDVASFKANVSKKEVFAWASRRSTSSMSGMHSSKREGWKCSTASASRSCCCCCDCCSCSSSSFLASSIREDALALLNSALDFRRPKKPSGVLLRFSTATPGAASSLTSIELRLLIPGLFAALADHPLQPLPRLLTHVLAAVGWLSSVPQKAESNTMLLRPRLPCMCGILGAGTCTFAATAWVAGSVSSHSVMVLPKVPSTWVGLMPTSTSPLRGPTCTCMFDASFC
mmetsp:Transcript_19889/g.55448  ORF Transcript_19889/g.55448 Transcript_19889/m.55448 type:complete len:296 (+) Transcript_19889:2411-3298(+)